MLVSPEKGEKKNATEFQSFSLYLCKVSSMGRPDDQEERQSSGAEPAHVILLPALKVGAFAGEMDQPQNSINYYSSRIVQGWATVPVTIRCHSQEFAAQYLIKPIGSAGFLVGGFAGLSRLATPGLFALVSGFQWFALGSTFWGTCNSQAPTSLLMSHSINANPSNQRQEVPSSTISTPKIILPRIGSTPAPLEVESLAAVLADFSV